MKQIYQKISITVLAVLALFLPLTLSPGHSDTNRQQQVLGVTTQPLRGEEPLESAPASPTLVKPLATDQIRAKSFLVFDVTSGLTLAEKQKTQQLPIASLTKLMTGYVTHRLTGLEGSMEITNKDINNTSPALGLIVGDSVPVEDVFTAMLVGSDNDAALALSNYVERQTGKKFIDLMNTEAARLNMNASHFSNPLGFDNGNNFATAQDLRTLVETTQKLPAFSTIGRKLSYSFEGSLGRTYRTTTTNKLIAKDPELTAIKTGYTESASGSMITKATHDGHSIIIIVLGSTNRENDTISLKKNIFDSYQW